MINCQKENGLCVIAIERAPRDRVERTCLADILAETSLSINSDSGVHVVLITGGADAFHFGEIQANPLPPDGEDSGYGSLAYPLARIDCPVIAAVSGHATGQGLELLMACDIRLAAEESSFCLPQLRAGMIPFDGGTQRLSRIVGKSKTLEMVLTGQRIDGPEAKRIGLINILVPPAELMTVAMDMARKMASQAPLSLKYAKEAIGKGMEMHMNQGLRLEADLYFLMHTTSDRREGIEAFREKRKPEFTGQ